MSKRRKRSPISAAKKLQCRTPSKSNPGLLRVLRESLARLAFKLLRCQQKRKSPRRRKSCRNQSPTKVEDCFSVRCNVLRTFQPALLGNAIRRQSRIANLIQQCPVADAQRPRRLLAIPVMILQDFQNDLPLQLTHCLASEFLQRNLSVHRNIGVEEIRIARRQSRSRSLPRFPESHSA